MSRNRTVLVVEDDPDLRAALELLLIRQGYHVVATGDGLRAVELAGQHRIDAAVVDLLIPGQSGFQVALDLKARYGDAVRVVLMSGIASQAQKDYAFAAGAEQFLAKPFTTSQLLSAVAAFCPPPSDPPAATRRTARIGQ
ncbi:response regulator transcription factor [Frigoriglobus tundricola]|uniref:Two-component response regulator n=1 Tax=Frigoriglobus tundricola TaxID=2774151 RepID=A0A6M5YU62_9BACT|nr:response regulator [Frigoriglobus tundricola]QJW96791.1 two-component response regulator [Frigoriglobus tundricola]